MFLKRRQNAHEVTKSRNYADKIYTPAELEKTKEILLADRKTCIEEILNLLISQAVMRKASDIHIDPGEHGISIKYRIDGMLCPVMNLPAFIMDGIIVRIKVLSRLVVYKRDIPQDGSIRISGKPLELRVTTFPTIYGEKAVIRIFDSSALRFQLEELGFCPEIERAFTQLILKPGGVILLTGPANSGKTTTLYASIQKILELRSACNIITLEDPVEYTFGNINQTQINPGSNLTYSGALRSIMRQDPEVILVGEIRDAETARIVMESGLTGHLILTTIHAGSASSVFVRLLEMFIEPFLLASAVSAVLNQRLVRKICPFCAEEYHPAGETIQKFNISTETTTFVRGKGCDNCLYQGYSGRTVVAELVVMDDLLKEFVMKKPSISQLKEFLKERQNRTLLDDGLEKVKQGITTIEEIERVISLP
jgi:type II secretory ATPase GspE/PulE/Tfp pilus assembly ATPase PilB-like protein